ncbi:TPA: glycosyltransferase, partial [Escherichia coli]|nr:glycosyltransferase [Escherichia coli]
MNVAILLSTYNGEKYLEEQLDSLLLQSYQDFVVYIRDDGSSDRTVNIINQY